MTGRLHVTPTRGRDEGMPQAPDPIGLPALAPARTEASPPTCPTPTDLTTAGSEPTRFPTDNVGDNADDAPTRPDLRAYGPDHLVSDSTQGLTAHRSTGMPILAHTASAAISDFGGPKDDRARGQASPDDIDVTSQGPARDPDPLATTLVPPPACGTGWLGWCPSRRRVVVRDVPSPRWRRGYHVTGGAARERGASVGDRQGGSTGAACEPTDHHGRGVMVRVAPSDTRGRVCPCSGRVDCRAAR